jgi:hypothetical protein
VWPFGHRARGNLADQLAPHGPREVAVINRLDEEGPRAADDVVAVVRADLAVLVEDGQAIDRNSRGHRPVAKVPRRRALVRGPVAGDIDRPPLPFEGVPGELSEREAERRTDRRPAAFHGARRRLDLSREIFGFAATGDQPPVEGNRLVPLVRPLDQRDGEPTRTQGLDGPEYLRMAEGLGQAAELQGELGRRDAGGAVDGEHQLQRHWARRLRKRRRRRGKR